MAAVDDGQLEGNYALRLVNAGRNLRLDHHGYSNGDQAQGEICARAWHLTADGSRQFVAWGRYADHYERRDNVWRFARRSFILDFSEDLPVTAGSNFGSEGVGTGCAGGDDPVHARLSLFARPNP